MKVRLHRRRKLASGCGSYGNGRPIKNKRIVVEFDGEMFREISEIAHRNECSFAAQVREFVEFCLVGDELERHP